jgi:hypothetical protein
MANDGDHILLRKGNQEGPEGSRDMQAGCVPILEPIVRRARRRGDLPGQQAQNHVGPGSMIGFGAHHQRRATLDPSNAREIGYDRIAWTHRQG